MYRYVIWAITFYALINTSVFTQGKRLMFTFKARFQEPHSLCYNEEYPKLSF